jgi:colanic acid biosynthesis glycosyl transferase WcaI
MIRTEHSNKQMLIEPVDEILRWQASSSRVWPVQSPKAMKILVYGLNYAPELTGIGKYTGELCAWLAKRGHSVKVVCGHPYYPNWRVADGYNNRQYSTEWREGVEIFRTPLYVPPVPSGKARILNNLSFAITSAPKLAQLTRQFSPDVLLCVAPSFFVAPAAALAGRMIGTPSWLHIQDFEIDSAFELGMLSGGLLRRIATTVETTVLKCFQRVSTISPKMVERLVRKGVKREDTVEFRNWVDTNAILPDDRMTGYRTQLALTSEHVVALYSGSIAAKQGIEKLVNAARTISAIDSRIVFVFCGSGAMRGTLMEAAEGLTNVRFVELQPESRMSELLSTADIHLIPQRAQVADLVLPSKLAPILASGRPLVAMAEPGTQLAKEVEGAGFAVSAADNNALVAAFLALGHNLSLREKMGKTARALARDRWDKQMILEEFEQELLSLTSQLSSRK